MTAAKEFCFDAETDAPDARRVTELPRLLRSQFAPYRRRRRGNPLGAGAAARPNGVSEERLGDDTGGRQEDEDFFVGLRNGRLA